MKTALLLVVLALSLPTFTQIKKDSEIIVTVTDTSNLYNRVAIKSLKASGEISNLRAEDLCLIEDFISIRKIGVSNNLSHKCDVSTSYISMVLNKEACQGFYMEKEPA